MKPLLTVVIPTYNEEKNITNCLRSLERQTIPRNRYEIIVVDGKSKDRTVRLAKKIADKVIYQKSRGVGGARNDGIRMAKADLVANTDADCTVPPFWIEKIIKGFQDPRVSCVFGPVRPIERSTKYKYYVSMNNFGFILTHKLGLFSATIGSNTAFRKKNFMRIGGYKQVSAGDDYEISTRIRRTGKIIRDRRLYVNFSMRRIEKFGAFGTLFNWFLNSSSLILQRNIAKVKYDKQDYD